MGSEPERRIRVVWADLHREWWRAALQAKEKEAEVAPEASAYEPNWPGWVLAETSDIDIDVVLHHVFAKEWDELSGNGASNRVKRVAQVLGLYTRDKDPWKMFIYFSLDTLKSIKMMKDLSAFFGRHSNLEPLHFLSCVNRKLLERHGERPNAPDIDTKDIRAVMNGI